MALIHHHNISSLCNRSTVHSQAQRRNSVQCDLCRSCDDFTACCVTGLKPPTWISLDLGSLLGAEGPLLNPGGAP